MSGLKEKKYEWLMDLPAILMIVILIIVALLTSCVPRGVHRDLVRQARLEENQYAKDLAYESMRGSMWLSDVYIRLIERGDTIYLTPNPPQPPKIKKENYQ